PAPRHDDPSPTRPPAPRPPLFPYTTLFRSSAGDHIVTSDSLAEQIDRIFALIGREMRVAKRRLIRFVPENLLHLLKRHAPHHERSEEHTSELQSPCNLVCRLRLGKETKGIL